MIHAEDFCKMLDWSDAISTPIGRSSKGRSSKAKNASLNVAHRQQNVGPGRPKITWTSLKNELPWLFRIRDEGEIRYGCKACKLAGIDSSFANATILRPRTSNLRRHAKSSDHMFAVARNSKSLGTEVKQHLASWAPSKEWFQKLTDATRQRLKSDHLGDRRKRAQGIFCVAEAMRIIDRQFFKRSSGMASHTDARKKRLTMRFAATVYE